MACSLLAQSAKAFAILTAIFVAVMAVIVTVKIAKEAWQGCPPWQRRKGQSRR